MSINVNLNEGMKHKHSRTWIIVITVVVLFIFLFLTFNGKHNKMPGGFETNIDGQKKDTSSIKNNLPKDTERHIVVIFDTIKQPVIIKERIEEVKYSSPAKKEDTSQKSKYAFKDNTFNAPW